MSEKINKIIENVKNLTVIELNNLVKSLEEEFGVSAMAPVAAVATAPAEAAPDAEEKTEFDVILKTIPAKKAPVIKIVKEVTGVGMMEAKTIVESAPKAIKEAIPKEEAESLKAKLIEAGAEVEVK